MPRLRDFTPRGYNARQIMMLIVPMIVFVIAMTLFFFSGHVQQVNQKLSRAMARELRAVIALQLSDPAHWDEFAQEVSRSGLMEVSFLKGAAFEAPKGDACCSELRDELDEVLSLPNAYAFDEADGTITFRAQLPNGVLEAHFERKRVAVITAHIFIVWSVGFSALLVGMSYAFMRNQVRSILQLTHAADAFGRGEDVPDFRPSGASEIRDAARSLIRMRNRIRRYADQRTAMLAGVSHDLRTPITRLKLELALLSKSVDVDPARKDLAEMEKMLDGYLAFARGAEGEQVEDSDLSVIAREASSHAEATNRLEFESVGQVPIRLRPLAVKRAIANLVSNAADHGDAIRVRVFREPGAAVVAVEDNGPGIAPQQYEEAFRPFSRLDAARNQNLSGVGLGLTMARDTARAHGGDLVLGKSEMGGLRAVLRLPFEVRRDFE